MEDSESAGKRRRSKVEAFYHLVWATQRRQACLTPDWERQIYRLIENTAQQKGCTILAIGGMSDHVHVVVRAPGKFSPSDLARMFKGPTSALINDLRPNFSEIFRWQEGYGCFTLSRPHIPHAISYVKNQKRHHSNGGKTLWLDWEETDEPADTPEPQP